MPPSRSIAIERPAGETAADIDVPSVIVTSICRVVGTSWLVTIATVSAPHSRRRSTQNPLNTLSYFLSAVSACSAFFVVVGAFVTGCVGVAFASFVALVSFVCGPREAFN